MQKIQMTPLDFRLTAAAVFRLLSMECSILGTTVDEVYASFLAEQLVAVQVLSQTDLQKQANRSEERRVGKEC